MTKRTKTKYPNIFSYETQKGTKYQVRRKYFMNGQEKEVNESGFTTLNLAKARLREIENQIEEEELGLINNKSITFDRYLALYIQSKENSWTKDTKYSVENVCKTQLSPQYGNTPLSKINRIDHQMFLDNKLKKYSRDTVRGMHNVMTAIMNDAVYTGVLERNRLVRMKINESAIPTKNKVITLEQYRIWIKTAEEILSKRYFTMVYLTTFGMRRGEVMGLKKKYITLLHDEQRAKIQIKETRTTAVPEGKSTKSNSSERTIFTDAKALSLLDYILSETAEIKMDFGEIFHEDDFVFISESSCKPINVATLNSIFKKVSDACDIKVHPHMLRHNFATQAALAGAPIHDTAKYLGHRNVTMTEHYTHATDEGLNNVINLVESRLSGA